jgi:hypothetical protein
LVAGARGSDEYANADDAPHRWLALVPPLGELRKVDSERVGARADR